MITELTKETHAWEQPRTSRDPAVQQYQDLKFEIHRKLLERINLEAVHALPSERVRHAW
jgi:hypothetical protein